MSVAKPTSATTPTTVTILGATGSIGESTLKVMALAPSRWRVFALTAHRNLTRLAEQCATWHPRYAVVPDDASRTALRALLPVQSGTEVLVGSQALEQVASDKEVDRVMAAVVGAAGLPACLAAARAGKILMLANKESLVVAGELLMHAAQASGATLIPIDSEHSAIFQCLPSDRGAWATQVRDITLTASGGPFRTRDPDTLSTVTPEEAVAHPNWVMGQKISVDSATMMNKALEVIEAHYLFALPPERIHALLHSQSVVHSMVCYVDGSVLAQLGTPDMCTPISLGLHWPARGASGADWLDLVKVGTLSFEPVDARRFPCFPLAYEALRAPLGACAVLNAANEESVAAFLARRLRYTDIHRVNASLLSRHRHACEPSLQALLQLDGETRIHARELIATCPAP